MSIQLFAYAFVEPKGPAPVCAFHEVPAGIDKYLERHVAGIGARADQGTILPARFQPRKAKEDFVKLRQGTDDEFLKAAQNLARQLDEATDHRMNRGFFVALRRTPPKGRPQAAVLKLDVYKKPAASLHQTAPNQAFFQAVKDLLDLPGDLHKGALYPDPRPHSDIAVVDRFDTQYFLQSIQAQQFVIGAEATRAFVEAIGDVVPEKADRVIQRMREEHEPFSPGDFVRETPDLFTAEEAEALAESFERMSRPIERVDPGNHPPRQAVVSADGVRITGSAAKIDADVAWAPHRGRYRITVDVDEPPVKTYS